jgi:hypothetical protein
VSTILNKNTDGTRTVPLGERELMQELTVGSEDYGKIKVGTDGTLEGEVLLAKDEDLAYKQDIATLETAIAPYNKGFKNYIINGDFRINQRADIDTAPVTSTANIYQIDRIRNEVSSANRAIQRILNQTVNNKVVNTIKIVSSSTKTTVIGVSQSLENFHKGETLTFSAWVKSNSTDARLRLKDGVNNYFSNPHSGSGEWEFLTLTATISASATELRASTYIISNTNGGVSIASGDYIESTMWQLEEGSVATPFENLSYALQYEQCRRYYRRYAIQQNLTDLSYQMRTTPTESGTSPYTYDAEL